MSFFKPRIIFLFAFLFEVSLSYAMAPEVVFLFDGKGADDRCKEGIEHTIESYAKPKPKIVKVENFKNLIVLLKAEHRRSLLVMPGGSSCFYEIAFSELTDNERYYLREEITSGRLCYLGICAGAYFASSAYEVVHNNYVIDNEGDDDDDSQYIRLKIKKESFESAPDAKVLGLFGRMKSAYDSFIGETWEGALGVEIFLDDAKVRTTIWNGGPAFADEDCEVIGRYHSSNKAAIVAKVFKGADGCESVAIVSGVHFELNVLREVMAGSNMPDSEFKKINPYDQFISKASSQIFKKFGFQ